MEAEFGVWTMVKDALPEKCVQVIVCYCNEYGAKILTTAEYVPPRTLLASDYLDDDCRSWHGQESSEQVLDEYDTEIDDYWVKEGWFECSAEWEYQHHISDAVYAWMPKPQFPETL